MKCYDVKRLLSAYYDNELTATGEDVDRCAIDEHLQNCDECRHDLQSYERLSNTAKILPELAPPDQWDAIEKAMVAAEQSPKVTPVDRAPTRRWSPQVVAPLAVIAIALVIVGGWMGLHLLMHDHRDHLAIDFDAYLASFQTKPEAAQQVLLANYNGRSMQMAEAERVLGYRPAAAAVVPGYEVNAVYVLDMPCCQCPQVVLQRKGSDGEGQIAIFEHEKDQPVWFGDRSTNTAICGGRPTRIVQVKDGYLAATWETKDRHLTIIGARNVDEVTSLVVAFGGHRS